MDPDTHGNNCSNMDTVNCLKHCPPELADGLGQMCLVINDAASNKVIAIALLMAVLLDDPDADVLNGIDGMSV